MYRIQYAGWDNIMERRRLRRLRGASVTVAIDACTSAVLSRSVNGLKRRNTQA